MIPNNTGPRMTMSAVKHTREANKPLRVAIYSTPGVGKTTFCSQAPDPIFLLGEAGASFLDVLAFPRPLSWWHVLEAVQSLIDEPHDRKSIVIDTLDGLEPLLFDHICKTNGGKKSIDEIPFGRGHVMAVDEWRKLLGKLERLQEVKGMNVLLTAHAVAREFKDPNIESSWKRWDMRLHAKAADEIAGWVDALLFATHEALPKKDGIRVRGVSTGERLMLTNWTAAYSAKNRYNLPPTLTLDWATFWEAAKPALRPGALAPVELSEADARQLATLETDAATLIAQLPDARQPKAREAMAAAVEARDLPRVKTLIRKLKEALDASSVTSAPDHNAA